MITLTVNKAFFQDWNITLNPYIIARCSKGAASQYTMRQNNHHQKTKMNSD